MNLNLDMKTVFTLVVLGHLFTIILISAYRGRFANDKAIRLFSLSKWLQAAAWAITMFRDRLPEFFGIVLPNCILFMATALEVLALLHNIYQDNLKVERFCGFLCAVSIFGFIFISIAMNDESIRIFYASFIVAVFVACPAYFFIREWRGSSALRRTMGAMYGLLFLGLLLRAALALPFTSQMSLFSAPNLFQNVTFVSLYFMMLVGNIGFVLLSKEHSDEQLLHLASYDDLTETLNRRTFIERSDQCIGELAREARPVSFILFDIDKYKQINDTYGHYVGDMVLRDMTDSIRDMVEKIGLIGRYGGDEFAVLLPGMDEEKSDVLAERLREQVATQGSALSHIEYTVSMGVVTLPAGPGVEISLLYKLCDEALYEAKKRGRNRVERSVISDAQTAESAI